MTRSRAGGTGRRCSARGAERSTARWRIWNASSRARLTTCQRNGGRVWLLDRGDAANALAAFQVAIRTAPGDPAGHIGAALVHLSRREDAAAAAALESLLASIPGDRYALQLLGTAYRRLGRDDDARFALTVGSTGQPSWTDPWSDDISQYRRWFPAMLKEATQLGLDR